MAEFYDRMERHDVDDALDVDSGSHLHDLLQSTFKRTCNISCALSSFGNRSFIVADWHMWNGLLSTLCQHIRYKQLNQPLKLPLFGS